MQLMMLHIKEFNVSIDRVNFPDGTVLQCQFVPTIVRIVPFGGPKPRRIMGKFA